MTARAALGLAALALSATGCASSGALTASERAVPSEWPAGRCGEAGRAVEPAGAMTSPAEIVVFRRPRFVDDRQAYALSLDGVFATWICPREHAGFAVAPGPHLVRVGCSEGWGLGRTWSGVTIDAVADDERYAEVRPGGACARVIAIPRAEAETWRASADPTWIPRAVRRELGRLAVVAGERALEVRVITPPRGGVPGGPTLVARSSGHPLLAAASLGLGVVLAPVGAIAGTRAAEPAELLESREAAVRGTVDAAALLRQIARGLAAPSVEVVPAAPSRLAARRFETVLVLSIERLRLGPGGPAPSDGLLPRGGDVLELSATVRVRLLRTDAGRERVPARSFEVTAPERHRLDGWAGDDARAFREGLDALAARAAAAITVHVIGRRGPAR